MVLSKIHTRRECLFKVLVLSKTTRSTICVGREDDYEIRNVFDKNSEFTSGACFELVVARTFQPVALLGTQM
jgi:hypothetical protein